MLPVPRFSQTAPAQRNLKTSRTSSSRNVRPPARLPHHPLPEYPQQLRAVGNSQLRSSLSLDLVPSNSFAMGAGSLATLAFLYLAVGSKWNGPLPSAAILLGAVLKLFLARARFKP